MLLWNQQKHRSAYIASMVSLLHNLFSKIHLFVNLFILISSILQDPKDDVVESYCHSMVEPRPLTIPIFEQAGFSEIAKLRHLKVDHALVTSLVERWRPETYTFHFLTSECTITLQDISLQLGLNVDGPPIVGLTMFDWEEMCDTYLGVAPVKGKSLIGSQVKLK